MKTITLNVTGMSCEGCVYSVRSALTQIEGVGSVDVSLDEKLAVVEVEDTVQAGDLVAAVESAGYQATISD